jgi:hypothetical protein
VTAEGAGQAARQPQETEKNGNRSPAPEGGAGPGADRYTVGTLSHTRAGLFVLFGWLLWGDFCFTLFESIGGPGILNLYLQDNFHVSVVQCTVIFGVNLAVYREWRKLGGDRGYRPPESEPPAAPAAAAAAEQVHSEPT